MNRRESLRLSGLILGVPFAFLLVVFIVFAWTYGGQKWNVTISFNTFGEGPLELVLFTSCLILLIGAAIVEIAEARGAI